MLQHTRYISKATCILTALTVALLAGCSSDSNPTGGGGGGGGGNPGGVPLASSVAPMPSGLQNTSAGSGAALGAGYINGYNNSISNYGSWFTGVPSPVRGTNQAMAADSTTYTVGDLVITVVVDAAINGADTSIGWSVVLNGSDDLNSYNNFLFIYGFYSNGTDFQSNLGSADRHHDISGALTVGMANQNGFMSRNDRATGATNAESWNWNLRPIIDDFYAHTFLGSYIYISVETNGSGTLEHNPTGPSGVKTSGFDVDYRAIWSADGTGSWTAYNSLGEIDSSGTF